MGTEESSESQSMNSSDLKEILLTAVEFGFKKCEEGLNLQAAIKAAESFFEELGE